MQTGFINLMNPCVGYFLFGVSSGIHMSVEVLIRQAEEWRYAFFVNLQV